MTPLYVLWDWVTRAFLGEYTAADVYRLYLCDPTVPVGAFWLEPSNDGIDGPPIGPRPS